MTKLRKPVRRALEAMEQLLDLLRDDLGDLLVMVRDHLKGDEPKKKEPRKK